MNSLCVCVCVCVNMLVHSCMYTLARFCLIMFDSRFVSVNVLLELIVYVNAFIFDFAFQVCI